jgi:hypothetical protein
MPIYPAKSTISPWEAMRWMRTNGQGEIRDQKSEIRDQTSEIRGGNTSRTRTPSTEASAWQTLTFLADGRRVPAGEASKV